MGRVGKDQSSNKKCNKYLLAKCITKKKRDYEECKKALEKKIKAKPYELIKT